MVFTKIEEVYQDQGFEIFFKNYIDLFLFISLQEKKTYVGYTNQI